MSTSKLYVWANPLNVISVLDHTWVTTYDLITTCPPDISSGDYWYCWGICHETGQYNPEARLLNSRDGEVTLATCISTPNDEDDHAGIAGIYGLHGVCHQVANRVLFSTANEHEEPLLVDGAHGFWLSYLLYGDYGGKGDNWEQVQKNCGVVNIRPNDMELQAMTAMLRTTLGPAFAPEMIDHLKEIQNEMLGRKHEFEVMVEQKKISVEEFAVAINNLLTDFVPRLVDVIGKDYSRIVFGVDPGDKVYLLDTEIAATYD